MKLYEWSLYLTTESDPLGTEKHFHVTDMAKALKRRLEYARGQTIIVTGMQGTGKTALRHWLTDTGISHSFQWSPTGGLTETSDSPEAVSKDKSFREWLIYYVASKYGQASFEDNDVSQYIGTLFKNHKQHDRYYRDMKDFLRGLPISKELTHFLVRKLPPEDIRSLKEDIEFKPLWEKQTIFIDFPDYDKKAKSRRLKDIQNFQDLWVKIRAWGHERALDGGEGRTPNLVIFWQEEISSDDHFFFGKFETLDITTPTPSEMAEFVRAEFDDVLFEQEALELLAQYARGVWRWFKKYIRICLDHNGPDTITTVDDAKQLIGLKELYEDWKRELSILFPKSRQKRKKAIEIIQYLQLNGETKTGVLLEQFFSNTDSGKVECSRMLNKLQEYEYVDYEYTDRKKMWRFSKV